MLKTVENARIIGWLIRVVETWRYITVRTLVSFSPSVSHRWRLLLQLSDPLSSSFHSPPPPSSYTAQNRKDEQRSVIDEISAPNWQLPVLIRRRKVASTATFTWYLCFSNCSIFRWFFVEKCWEKMKEARGLVVRQIASFITHIRSRIQTDFSSCSSFFSSSSELHLQPHEQISSRVIEEADDRWIKG